MKKTFVERIKSIGSGLDAAMNYLSEDLDAICDDTMREYAESALHSVKESALHASYLHKNVSLYLDTLTDISVNVGWQQLDFEDSRKRNALVRQWAEEFVDLHADTDWQGSDYRVLIDEFTEKKLKDHINGHGCSSDEPVEDKPYKISYVLGTEAVREYSNCVDNGETWSISSLCDCGSVSHGEFATQAELDAYKQGIEDATGWLESEVIMTDKEWKGYLEKYFSDEDDD